MRDVPLREASVIRAPSTLYVAGGLYGNLMALDAIEKRAAKERTAPTIVFNGDFNFFNVAPRWWRELNSRVRDGHIATAGNVEVESATIEASGLGCGCGYPRAPDVGVALLAVAAVAAIAASAAVVATATTTLTADD